jgi:dipeptidase E
MTRAARAHAGARFDLSRVAGLPDGLGLLPGSACPHYDGDQRRPLYRRLSAEEGFPPGWAADDAAALVFEGVKLREVVTTASGSTGYRVDLEGEHPLAARLL